ncbi:MAG: flagellar biosynthesis protein FliQ [Actinomycetota bacterium]
MDDATILEIVTRALWTASQVSAPVLLTALAVGVFMGLLQSVTQIQEPTMAFVPKFAAVGLVIALTGSWMLQRMIDFTTDLLIRVPDLL